MRTALAEYRRTIIAPHLSGGAVLNDAVRHAAAKATVANWGIDPELDGEDSPKVVSAMAAANMLVVAQAPLLLPTITVRNRELPFAQLELLNTTYELDGVRKRYGEFHRSQGKRIRLKLKDSELAIARAGREMDKLLRLCKHDDRPIADQL